MFFFLETEEHHLKKKLEIFTEEKRKDSGKNEIIKIASWNINYPSHEKDETF